MSERIEVDAAALRQILVALNGKPHEIRELMVLRNAPAIICDDDPITKLTEEFNAWAQHLSDSATASDKEGA